jgi:hypothetical protein
MNILSQPKPAQRISTGVRREFANRAVAEG